jgi:hypothetical protein
MKTLTLILSLIITSLAFAEEPAELSERRQAWETQRSEAQGKVDKLYFEELDKMKKNFTQARNIAAALAVDNVIKGGEKADNEPAELSKMRIARNKSLKKALTPIDKQYWKDLKKLKEDFIKEGKLDGVVIADAEIEKVLAAYKKPELPKQKKQETAEENSLNGKWNIVYDNNHRRSYLIEEDDITVVASSFRGEGEKTKLKKYKKGLIVRFSLRPYTEYLYLDGNRMFIQHWSIGRDPKTHSYTNTATGTKVVNEDEQ